LALWNKRTKVFINRPYFLVGRERLLCLTTAKNMGGNMGVLSPSKNGSRCFSKCQPRIDVFAKPRKIQLVVCVFALEGCVTGIRF